MKLIDKDALVAEINKRIIDAPIDCYGHQRVWAYNDVKDIINTMEMKGTDLDEEFNDFLDNVDGVPQMWHSNEQIEWAKDIARHFYELGLKARNEDAK